MGKRKHAEASQAEGSAAEPAQLEREENAFKKTKKAKQQQQQVYEQTAAAAPSAPGTAGKPKKQDEQQPAAVAPGASVEKKKKNKKKKDKQLQQQQQQPAVVAAGPSGKQDKKKDKQQQAKQLQLPPGLALKQLLQPSVPGDAAASMASHVRYSVEVWRDPRTNEKQLSKQARRAYAKAAKAKSSKASGSSANCRSMALSTAELAAISERAAWLQRGCGPFVFMLGAAGLGEADEKGWGFEVHGDPQHKEAHPMFLASRLPGANLIATTEQPVQSAGDTAHYVVGICNMRTRQLRLSEAAGSCMLRLEAQAANVADADVAGVIKASLQQRQGELPQDQAARRVMARRLVQAFGSTRRKRQMKQREEGAVVVERNADEDRLQMLLGEVAARAQAAGETRQEVMSKLGAHRNIPVHNPAATLPHQAYKISAMFPDHLLSAINVGQILHAAEKQEDRQRLASKQLVPEYALSRLQRVSDETDARKRKRAAKLLALLSVLLQLASARSKLPLKPPRPAKEEGAPARPGGLQELSWSLGIRRVEVLEPLLDMFYNKTAGDGTTVYVREDYKQQLLLMHVLVVALDVEGWSLAPPQFDALRKQLKMTAGDVVARFRELGCVCKAAKVPTGVAPDGTPTAALPSYSVALLPGGPNNTKTLEQCFPKAKTGAKQRGNR